MATEKRIEDLTDEELAGMSPEQFASLASGQDAPPPVDHNGNDDPDAQAAAEEAARLAEEEAAAAAEAAKSKDDTNEDPDAEKTGAADGVQAGSGDAEAAGKSAQGADAAKDPAAAKADAGKVADPATVDYKSQVDALLAPFKANGREMKVESVDEARQLMSMGANYNKKMQGMKPHLSTLRMLENAKIGQNELNFLIDLHRRDPVAINKLVQESGIDPMDLSADKAAGYVPNNHRPADSEVELNLVLEELKDSPTFERTVSLVTDKFDPKSKQAVAQAPAVLKVLNNHVESGIYDLVQTEVDRQRMFGQLSGLSDLEAYRQVGDAMNAEGKFAHLVAGQPQQGQQTPPAAIVPPPNPKKAEDESKRNDAKRAVAPTRSTAASGAGKADFNPLSMSDEEFAKLGGKF